MDFLKTKNVFFNGKEIKKLFYGENLIWSRMRNDFSVDLRNLKEEEEWEGALLYDTIPNILRLEDHDTWSKSTASKDGGIYTVKRDLSLSDGWGIITEQTLSLVNGQVYTLYAEVSTKDLPQFNYNYIISADGNQSIGNINLITDGKFHPIVLTFRPNKNRNSAGILFGVDSRRNTGTEYQIKNMALFKGSYPQVLGGGIIPKGFRIWKE